MAGMTWPSASRWGRGDLALRACFGLVLLGSTACSSRTIVQPVAPDHATYTPPAVDARLLPTRQPITPTPTLGPPATRVVELREPLSLPEGFGVSIYAERLGRVALLATAPTGEVFATVPDKNQILVMPDQDRDGVADQVLTYVSGYPLNQPSGLTFWAEWLYVANTDSVWRFAYAPGDVAPWRPPQHIVDLPGGGDHWARGLAFGLDDRLYVAVGSSCNVCLEPDVRRAAILRHGPEGQAPAIFALGLRDPVGLAVDPRTGWIWAGDCGRDGLGPDFPPDEINHVTAGDHYGWPFCLGRNIPERELGNDPRLCEHTRWPTIELPAHSVPRGLAFYAADQFPDHYRGNLFVALAGDRRYRTGAGFRIIRVPFSAGMPSGQSLDFATGWLWPDLEPWGQPYGLTVAADGSLLTGDMLSERIYRVFYRR